MKALIIGSGPSTADLVPYRTSLKYFDIIIGLNATFMHWDDVLTHHLITEKHFAQQDIINQTNWSKTTPRWVNYKSIGKYNPIYSLQPITRLPLPPNHNLRRFIPGDPPGLLTGPLNKQGLSLGSVLLQAIHLAYIHQATDIYTIGADLQFRGEYDHYYEDRYYRDRVSNHPNAAKPIKTNGISTTDYFYESAPVIDYYMENHFKANFYDFSAGLLRYPTQVSLKLLEIKS